MNNKSKGFWANGVPCGHCGGKGGSWHGEKHVRIYCCDACWKKIQKRQRGET